MGLLTWAVAMTNDWHRLMYVSAIPINDQPGAALDYSHGFWFFATTVYLYAFMVLSVVVTASGIHRAAPAYRAHYLGFLLAMAVPWMANIGYVTGNAFLFDFDPTPFSFLLMGSVFYWLITRRRLFALLPVARHALLDAVPDPVLVLDADGTVVEANPAALALSAAPGGLIGRRLADLPDLGPALAERNVPTDGLQARLVSLGQGAGRRAFEATRVAWPAAPWPAVGNGRSAICCCCATSPTAAGSRPSLRRRSNGWTPPAPKPKRGSPPSRRPSTR